jgi:hypothetical protein
MLPRFCPASRSLIRHRHSRQRAGRSVMVSDLQLMTSPSDLAADRRRPGSRPGGRGTAQVPTVTAAAGEHPLGDHAPTNWAAGARIATSSTLSQPGVRQQREAAGQEPTLPTTTDLASRVSGGPSSGRSERAPLPSEPDQPTPPRRPSSRGAVWADRACYPRPRVGPIPAMAANGIRQPRPGRTWRSCPPNPVARAASSRAGIRSVRAARLAVPRWHDGQRIPGVA